MCVVLLVSCPSTCVCLYICHLSPTDYQSILAELQSPAALHSNPNFLEPELPVTPNPSPAPHHQHPYPDPDTPILADPQTQTHPPPWSPEAEPCSGEPDSPPRSPPRPCELALSFPAFHLPDPKPPPITKPHIALNDKLLLSEEEDRSFHETELNHKPKSFCSPERCELERDMAHSTSSLSLSSSPSSPERAQKGERGQTGSPDGAPEDGGMSGSEKEVIEELEEVVKRGAAESVEGNGVVEVGQEKEGVKNLDKMDEVMKGASEKITGDGQKLAEENKVMGDGRAESAGEGEDGMHEHVEQGNMMTAHGVEGMGEGLANTRHKEAEDNVVEAERGCSDREQRGGGVDLTGELQQGRSDGADAMGGQMDCQGEDVEAGGEGVVEGGMGASDGDKVAEERAAADLSPQAWVVALGELQPSESGSNGEEEDGDRDAEVTEEMLKSLLEEVKMEGGSEEEEGEEMTEARVQEILSQVKQAEKDMCSLPGWHSESSSVNVEPPTPGRSLSSDLLDRQENRYAPGSFIILEHYEMWWH